MTSKQPKGGQGTTGVRTRSGLVKIKSGLVKVKSGLVKMLQGIGYIEFMENSHQDRVNGKVC